MVLKAIKHYIPGLRACTGRYRHNEGVSTASSSPAAAQHQFVQPRWNASRFKTFTATHQRGCLISNSVLDLLLPLELVSRLFYFLRVSLDAVIVRSLVVGGSSLKRSLVKRPPSWRPPKGSGPIGRLSACHNTWLYREFIESDQSGLAQKVSLGEIKVTVQYLSAWIPLSYSSFHHQFSHIYKSHSSVSFSNFVSFP